MFRLWARWLAWMLGAFTLVILGAVAGHRASQELSPTPTTAAATPTVSDSGMAAWLQEREQAYRALIEEANARLEEAYRRIRELQEQQPEPTPPTPDVPAAASELSPKIPPARAIWAAVNAVPGAALLREPELVIFQGALAYEISLDRGLVYVDANTGQILYNGAAVLIQPAPSAALSQPAAPSTQRWHGDDDDERDKDKDED